MLIREQVKAKSVFFLSLENGRMWDSVGGAVVGSGQALLSTLVRTTEAVLGFFSVLFFPLIGPH